VATRDRFWHRDHAFLNSICRTIVEISRERLYRYTGVDDFVSQKRARDQLRAAYKNQQREIARREEFVNRFRAKASKASQAQERLKRLAKIDRLEAPPAAEATISFRYNPCAVVSASWSSSRCDRYGKHVVYEKLDLTIQRGSAPSCWSQRSWKIDTSEDPRRAGRNRLGHAFARPSGHYWLFRSAPDGAAESPAHGAGGGAG
jgi:hypothetical protein